MTSRLKHQRCNKVIRNESPLCGIKHGKLFILHPIKYYMGIYPVMHVLEIFKLNISDNSVKWKIKHEHFLIVFTGFRNLYEQ